ncbi:unnamed protein product, partial [Effrenium voratum]
AELGQCRADLERLQSSSGSLEQAKAALEAELQERQATMEALEGRLRQVKEALQAREEAKASVELELQRAKEAEAKLTEELEQSTATVSAAEEAKAELTRKLQDMADHLRDLETKKGEVEAELQSYRAASEKEQKSTKEVSREDLEWLPTFWEEDEDETGGQVEAQPGGPEQAQAALEALEDQLRRTQGAAEARQEAKASVEERLQRAEEAESAVWAELQQAQAAVLAAEETNAALAAKVEESKDAVEAAERFKADLQPSLESFKDRILALEAQLQSGDQPVQEAGRGAGEGNGGDDVHGRSWTCCAKRRPQEATSMEELGFRLEGLTRRASTWNRARTQAEAKMEILAASAAAAEQRLQEAKEEGQTAMVELAQSQAELRTATAAEAAAAVRLAQSEAASAAAEEAKAELTAEVRESKDAVAAAERFKADLQKALANLKDRILALEAELPALEEPEASERGSAGVQDEGGDPVSMVGLSAWCARRRAQEVVSIEELGSRLEGLTKRARSWERGKAEVEARMEILAASATAAEQHLQEAKEEGQTAAAELAQCQDELQKAKETEAALTAELQQSKAAAAASEEAKAELAAELRESKDAVEAAKRFKADLQPGLASLKDRILALELRLPDEPAQARANEGQAWSREAAAKSRRFSLSCCGQRRRSQEAGSVEELGNRLQALVQRLDALKRDKSEAEARLFATSAAVTALEKQLAAEAEVEDEFEALPPFWEEKERKPMDAAAQVRLQSLEVANVDLGHQLRQSKEESQAAQVQLQKAKETEAALEFELEQSKAALAAAEADKAELTDDLQESQDAVQAAEHFKADLQPGLESFKDRILALEAQLGRGQPGGQPGDQPGDLPAQAGSGGETGAKSGRSLCCGHRRRSQEAASLEELGSRLQGLTRRAGAWNGAKAQVEAKMEILAASAAAAEQQLNEAKDEGQAATAELAQCQDELQKAKETEAALTAELEQTKATAAASEEAKAELTNKVQESKDAVEGAERLKADLQAALANLKDRILALEAQLPKDQPSDEPVQVGSAAAEEARDEGEAGAKSGRFSLSCCGHRRRSQEASSVEELSNRVQALTRRAGAWNGAKAQVEAKMEILAASAAAAQQQLNEAKEEGQASAAELAQCQDELQKAQETEAALTAELEQTKATAAASEEAKAELTNKVQESKDAVEGAERLKADLQAALANLKDRILALEAQFPSDSEQAEVKDAEDGQDEGSAKSRRRSLSCCARRRTKEAASIEELGFRLQGVAGRLNALKQGKAEVEANMQNSAAQAAALEEQVRVFQAREEAIASAEAQLQEAKETEAALTAELEQSKAAVSAAEEAQAELAAKVQESKDAAEAAERFKANLQPSIESFKDRILALEAQFPGDSEQAEARDAADGQDEGEAGKSRRRSLSCCARRRPKEAASMEELGFRLQGVVERLSALKGKPDVQVPELESFKDRIVELEAKLHDQPPEVGSGIEEARDEGDAATKSRRFSLSCCGHRRRSQEASVEELGKRLQALAQRVDVLKRGKSEAEAQLATSSAVAAALEQQLAKPGRMASTSGRSTSVSANLEELPTFGEDEEQEQVEALGQDGGATDISTVRLQSLADANADLGRQLQQAKEESQAAQAQLQKAKEMEQDSKNAAEAAERFKADLQPSLESFKDRILALEAQLPGDQPAQAEARGAEDGQDEGEGSGKSRHSFFSCCARRRPQEAASMEELGNRLQVLVQRLDALKQGKAEAEAQLASTSAVASALEQQLTASNPPARAAASASAASVQDDFMALPTFGEDEEQPGAAAEISNVRLQSLAAANSDLGRQLQQSKAEHQAAQAELQKAKEAEAALMAKLEQSKAVVSAAEEAQADLEAAERFKADLQPGLESFKDRILALEAQLSGDQPTEAEVRGAEDGQDEGASAKSRRRSFSCCARRQSQDILRRDCELGRAVGTEVKEACIQASGQEAASVEELGFRLQGVVERLNALKQGKAEAEVAATTLGQQLQQSQEECTAAKGQLQQMKDALEAREEAKASVEAQLQKAEAGTAQDGQDEGASKPRGRSFSCCARRRSQDSCGEMGGLGRKEAASVEELGFRLQARDAELLRLQGVATRLKALKQGKAEVEAKMESTAVSATALEQQLQQSQEEFNAAKAELGQCHAELQQLRTSSSSLEQAKAALEAELEQSKAAVSIAEEAKADLEAAERFKADLQPSLESFKDRILALEAQLPGDQRSGCQVAPLLVVLLRETPEVAAVEELGNRLQALVQRLDALKRSKAEAEAQLATTSAVAAALEQQLVKPGERVDMALPTFGEDEEQGATVPEISNVRLQSLAAASAALGRQLRQSQEEAQAAQAQLQRATAELEQSKAAVSAAEEAKADLAAAERFKADLQPGLESFKDRILALEAQLEIGDQPAEAEVRADEGQDEGGAAVKSRRRSLSCCARRRPQDSL